MKKKLNILILEDHPIIREVIKEAASDVFPNAEIIETASNSEALPHLKEVDIAFIDIQLGKADSTKFELGTDVIQRIREINPHAKIIIVTSVSDDARIIFLLETFKPEGFIIKTSANNDTLRQALRDIEQRKNYYSDEVQETKQKTNKLIQLEPKLKWREYMVILYRKQGLTNVQIGQQIGVKERTVQRINERIREVFEIDTSASIVEEAQRRGLL